MRKFPLPGLKKIDFLIIIFSLAGILISFFLLNRADAKSETILAVYYDDKRETLPIRDGDYKITSRSGWVIIKIREGKIKISDSSCPDKWCVRMGPIEKEGDSIVCLPSKIFLIVEDKKKDKIEKRFDTLTR